MDGRRALEYARSRMSTSDFDRAKRQQLILLAIQTKALSLATLPRWPLVAQVVADAVQTDVGPNDLPTWAIALAWAGTTDLKQLVLEPPLAAGHRRSDGAAVLLPDWDRIGPALEELFGPPVSR